VIDDDFPAVVCVLEDEREEALRVTTLFFAAFEAISAGDDSEIFIERVDLEFGEAEGAHGGSGGVVALVLVEQAGEAAEDLVSDEEGIGRVFESTDVAGEIAFVPGVLLGKEDLDDIELLTRGGVQRVRLLGWEDNWCDEGEAESGEAESETTRHKESLGERWVVGRYGDELSHRTYARYGRIDSSRSGWQWGLEKKLGTFAGRKFFARFYAGGGSNPNDGDEGDEAKRQAWMLEGERDSDEIDEEGKVVFALDGGVFRFQFSRVAQAAADGQPKKEKAEAGQDHGGDVDGDGEGVHLLFEDVGGKEREQREAEEEAEVGVEDTLVSLFGAVDEVVMVDPVNPHEGEGDEIEAEGGENGAETGEAVLVGNLEFEHHDGDDDGDDSVREGLEASWGGSVMGHGWLLPGVFRLWQKHTTAIVRARACS
jgi:hypothetical protein